jgi:hypothetical protein
MLHFEDSFFLLFWVQHYKSTPESDFDLHQPAHLHALVDVMHSLRFAPVQWNEFRTTYVHGNGQAGCPG